MTMHNPPPGRRKGVPAKVLRGPYDPAGQPQLNRPDHLHLSLFAWNVRNGLSASKIVLKDPDRYQDFWTWSSAKKLLQATEAAGFDSQLQYGMWSGYGGATGWNEAHYDFATAAATSAAVTERIGIISTMHVGYQVPPLIFAKILASIDHVSGGRLGLNIVAGQNSVDYAQFGLVGPPSQEIRYAIADEMVTALKHLWSSDEPVDFEGEYFQFYGAQDGRGPRPRGQGRGDVLRRGRGERRQGRRGGRGDAPGDRPGCARGVADPQRPHHEQRAADLRRGGVR
ncbi:MAG: LLM class flavin-dependent oxidoreductase [Nocardioides sp.]|uniref:LLM class flavin-dependent oxidoreductase n=1 Tax=Nocardioides sp. TaxID=35761 RepID=UPI0039E316B3